VIRVSVTYVIVSWLRRLNSMSKSRIISGVCLVFLAVSGCSTPAGEDGDEDGRPSSVVFAMGENHDAPESRETRMPVAESRDPRIERFVALAKTDLSRRLSVEESSIEVQDVAMVTWSDASLGCPHPEMRYKQVPVDGTRITLRAGGRDYAYHSGGNREPFLCDTRKPLKKPAPKLDPFDPRRNHLDE
jgi:hypothetical protein